MNEREKGRDKAREFGRSCELPKVRSVQFSRSVNVRLFATPGTAAHQVSLSITNAQSVLKLMSIESVRPSSYLILCRPQMFAIGFL